MHTPSLTAMPTFLPLHFEPCAQNLAWEAQQQAKQQNQQAATQLLNKMGGTAPGVKLNPIKLQVGLWAGSEGLKGATHEDA